MTPLAAEDLLIRARRGELGEDEARRFEIAVGASRELALLYEAGAAFDAQAELLPGDEERMGALVAGALEQLERAEPSPVGRGARPWPRRRSDARFFASSVGFGMLLAVALASAWQAAERRHWLGGAPERSPAPAPAAVVRDSTPRGLSPPVAAPPPASATPAPRAAVNPPRRGAVTGGASSSRAVVNERAPASVREAPSAPASSSELFARANEARRRGSREPAIALYEELIARYPTSVEAEDARVLVGNLRLNQRSPSAALSEFERYGAGALTPEALWGQARALRSLQSAEERQILERIVREYPSSPYANGARQRLRQLSP